MSQVSAACPVSSSSADFEHRLSSAVIDRLTDQIAVLDAAGTIIAVNQSWRRFALDNGAADPVSSHCDIGVNYLAICRDASGGTGLAAAAGISAVLAGEMPSFVLEYDCHRPDRRRWFSMAVSPLGSGWSGVVVAHHDITAQREAESDLRVAAVALESFEGVIVTDARGVILRVNRGFTRITGYTAEEALGHRPSMLRSGRHDAAFYRRMWADIARDGHWEGEIWNRSKSGQAYLELLSISEVREPHGAVSHYVAVLSDITQRKADSDAIHQLAFYDPLTRLPNRRLLLERLRQQLRGGGRREGCGALLFIDLDNFKSLNDRFGHNAGDLLLQQVAQRLQDSVREADTVCRLGGDEFVVLCDGLGQEDAATPQATALGAKLLTALSQPYLLGTHLCNNTPSIGVTLLRPASTAQPEELLMQADFAMYQAKQAGRNNVRFFDKTMQDSIDARAGREGLLRSALARQQLELHYQLQIGADGHARGAEAILMWRRADSGLEGAQQFIEPAEQAGLLAQLTDWALEQACTQLCSWQEQPLLSELVLSLNICAAQWREPDFCERVAAAVARHGLQPSRLRLELPETLLLKHDELGSGMRMLRRAGIGFALDNFGAGLSSLRLLGQLPLDQLKIDASLVVDLAADGAARAVVLAAIAMARALRLEIVAEGVDTQAQRDLLHTLGCECYQGRWHSPPLPLAEFQQRALLAY